VRARLYKILAEARAAQKSPWESARFSLYRTIFPQMTLFLPEDEASQLRFTFETVLGRLKTARAAFSWARSPKLRGQGPSNSLAVF
jgi:hypothetical protein